MAIAVTSDDLTGRLQRYSRYVAVVADQLEAFGSGNLDFFKQLSGERARLEEELGELTVESPEAVGKPHLADYLQIGRTALEDRLDSNRQTQETWSAITDEALRFARTFPSLKTHAGSYPDLTDREATLDLRF